MIGGRSGVLDLLAGLWVKALSQAEEPSGLWLVGREEALVEGREEALVEGRDDDELVDGRGVVELAATGA